MDIVTNRKLYRKREGLDIFGSTLNPDGSNELRLVRVTKQENHYETEELTDRLTSQKVAELKRQHNLQIKTTDPWYASLMVACETMERARNERKHILVYVHGYNNDVGDVLRTAEFMERMYNVLVLPFSWPANGGGKVSGTAAYLSDKSDARSSVGALYRFIDKVREYHNLLTVGRREELWKRANQGFENNPMAAQERFTKLLNHECRVSINLLCHSMGNYLLKYALIPGDSPARHLVFDNIALVAADANNTEHETWMERLQFRNRLYVVINENDYALAWSRRKPGQEQLARLGHYLKNLVARNARYIDVTSASHVENKHGYFADDAVEKNLTLRDVFHSIFEGRAAEHLLHYLSDRNAYEIKGG